MNSITDTGLQMKKSVATVGILHKVLVCKQHPDRLLSGKNRAKAAGGMANIDKEELDVEELAMKSGLSHESAETLVTMNGNIQRIIPEEETQRLLLDLAKDCERRGCPKDRVASELAKKVPFSRQYVLKLLPKEFKQIGKAVSPGRPRSKSVNPDKQNYDHQWVKSPPNASLSQPQRPETAPTRTEVEEKFRELHLEPEVELIQNGQRLEVNVPEASVPETLDRIKGAGYTQFEIHILIDLSQSKFAGKEASPIDDASRKKDPPEILVGIPHRNKALTEARGVE